ncbi:hypothetical protein [Kibdelosporangium aridum]|uniref:Respiratory nitrate reductase chaperone NarJ n=1 Tax=Kibdelosporangium aridum TaxID=2030 RepID=A0A1W2FIR8_KIBAR|nr:hypothetical protein [Kibdelosporangium aridum]SMD21634.1 respiratory nitrate reductase chaperone NarJ [Kibdelosporangium aridum]
MDSLQLAHFVASAILAHPAGTVRPMLPSLRAATESLPGALAGPLTETMSYLDKAEGEPPCCLHLTCYAAAGQARFDRLSELSGLRVTDHLAVILECSAAGYTREAVNLLVAHREALDLLWGTLNDLGSHYAHTVEAVQESLSGGGLVHEAPAPRLARFERPDHRVPGLGSVLAGVLRGR